MHRADVDAHRLHAFVRDDDLIVIRCVCGWLTRAGSPDDGFDYLDRHVAHATPGSSGGSGGGGDGVAEDGVPAVGSDVELGEGGASDGEDVGGGR
ncbi:MAG: hypothetical protein V7636_1016 [Actinomycetota bacterium]